MLDLFYWIGCFVVVNWIGCFIISWLAVLWLWFVSKDIKFEGWVTWRSIIKIARFRLISKHSWYAKLWDKWYGLSLFLIIVHRDEVGDHDDMFVEQMLIHELQHIIQLLSLGCLFWIIYVVHSAYLKVMTSKDPYKYNLFEVAAVRAETKWMANGRPRIIHVSGARY